MTYHSTMRPLSFLTSNYSAEELISDLENLCSGSNLNDPEIDNINLLLFLYHRKNILSLINSKLLNAFQYFSKDSTNIVDSISVFSLLQWSRVYRKEYLNNLYCIINDKISGFNAETLNDSFHSNIDDWLVLKLKPFSNIIIGNTTVEPDTELFYVELLAYYQSKRLFELIAEYPDSIPSLNELKSYIRDSEGIAMVGQQLRKILDHRLLHLGANTAQILDFYISMIKALRIVDSSDSILNYVAQPVRSYLKTRSDTVRCIISSLTESKESDLHSELKQGGSLVYGPDEDDEDGGPGIAWSPMQRNSNLNHNGDIKDSRSMDILATMVSIYGSTDLFIAEYRSLLAKKIISGQGFSLDHELVNTELLKIRFGEESLHCCEVMLKDVDDSKRLNNARKLATKPNEVPSYLELLIVSNNYWPEMSDDTFKLHSNIKECYDNYCTFYSSLKKPRTLNLLPQLGCVDLDLQFDDGSVRSFSTSPLQANIICYLFEDPKLSSLQALCLLAEVDEGEALSALQFWVREGVLSMLNNSSNDLLFQIIHDQSSSQS